MNKTNRAKEDLKNKLMLEKRMERKLARLFQSILYDVHKQILELGTFVARNWFDLFLQTYKEHYKDVEEVFADNLQRQKKIIATEEEKDEIHQELLAFFSSLAMKSAREATNTTVINARDAVRGAMLEKEKMEDEGIRVTDAVMATIVANLFRARLQRRKRTIATTETQKAAEKAKEVEFNTLEGTKARSGAFKKKGTKDWYAVLDDRTRPTHVTADRTQKRIPIDKPFNVGRAQLMFPGDTSLGAPIEEWINCRCTCVYNPSRK